MFTPPIMGIGTGRSGGGEADSVAETGQGADMVEPTVSHDSRHSMFSATALLPRSNLAVFAYLAAWGLSLHLAAERDWWSSPVHAATTIAALAVVWRPNSRVALGVLAAAWVGVWAWETPRAYNHTTLFALLLVVVPLLLLTAWRRSERGSKRLEELLFPYVRMLVYLLFGFAALQKMNRDYLDPALSCGVEHLERLADRTQLFASLELDRAGRPLIVSTLLLEIAIPILLSIPRTRTAGLALAFGFHYLVGFNSLWSFSAPAVALYVAFVNPDFADRMRVLVVRSRGLCRCLAAVGPSLVAIAAIGIVAPDFAARVALALYVVSAPLFMGLILFGSWRVAAVSIGRLRAPLAIGGMIALLIGLSPYLGLGTRANLAMFSNLQTEGERWNHLFLPEEMQIFSLQDNLVTFEDSTSPIYAEIDSSGLHMATSAPSGPERIVEFEFVRAAHAACEDADGPIPAGFLVNGEAQNLNDICSEPRWSEPHAFPVDHLLRFRVVSTPSLCRQ